MTLSTILAIFGIIGGLFAVFQAIFGKQAKTDTTDAVLTVRLNALESNLKTVIENHLPHIDGKINSMQSQIAELDRSITRLATIIDERIPKKACQQ